MRNREQKLLAIVLNKNNFRAGLKAAVVIAASSMMALNLTAPAWAVGDGTRLKARDGASALVKGKSFEAVTNYTQALTDPKLGDDRRATILNDRAVAYLRLGRTREALNDFNQAVKLFPEYAAVYNNRGNLLMALGLPKEAIKDFNRAITLAPGYAAAYNNRAGAYVQVGSTDLAMRDYTRAVKLMPSNPAPLAGRGQTHLALGRPHAAIRDFSRAVSTDARFASAYRSRAEAKLKVAHFDEAIEDLSRGIAFDVSNPEAYRLRGHAYLALERYEEALSDFSRVVALAPSKSTGYQDRGLAYIFAENFAGALADLNNAIELDSRSARAFAFRAFAYVKSDQADVASNDLKTAAKLNKNDADVHWVLAEIADARGQTEKAVLHAKKALDSKPGYKRAIDVLVRLGIQDPNSEDRLVPGLEIEGWQVVMRGENYLAVNEKFPRIRVPLEPMGEGKPRLLSWELKKWPFKDVGVLTFHGGVIPGEAGAEEVEFGAIVDLRQKKIVAIEPHRQGKEKSTWTWQDNGRVTVASIDGVTDEFALRTVAPGVGYGRRGFARGLPGSPDDPAWAPWADGMDPYYERPRKKKRRARRRKKKNLFQLLFGG